MSFHGLSMYIAIAGGGAIGTALRLLVFHLVSRQGSDLSFVLSTVMVNVIGSGALGALVAMRSVGPQLTSDTRSIILIGVLGGFTTFSAFTFDIISHCHGAWHQPHPHICGWHHRDSAAGLLWVLPACEGVLSMDADTSPSGPDWWLIDVGEDWSGARLDRFLRRVVPGLTQGPLEKMLRSGLIRLDGAKVKPSTRIETGQSLRMPAAPKGRDTGPGTGQVRCEARGGFGRKVGRETGCAARCAGPCRVRRRVGRRVAREGVGADTHGP